MKKYFNLFCLWLLFLTACATERQDSVAQRVDLVTYKKIGNILLTMKVYYPKDFTREKLYPVIVLFHGGGWENGSMDQLKPQALELVARGMVAITPEYRLKAKHGTSPYESVKDACSAIRFIRDSALVWSLNLHKIAVCGASAGGHLAAATDFIQLNDVDNKSSSSPKPDLLILFNPVINNGPGNYGFKFFGDDYKAISPFHNIKAGGAPTLILSGTKDNLVSPGVLQEYQTVMKQYGNECKLLLYEGQGHGFFNYKKEGNKYYTETLTELIAFLKQHGYL